MNMKTQVMLRLIGLFRITELQSWSRVSASDVLAVPGVGKSTLNKLRLHLARQGISLRGDNPPDYWIDAFSQPAKEDAPVGACPFTVVIDTNETYPFPFDSIYDREGAFVPVRTVRRPLYQMGLADYTIDGMETLIQIERKADDLAPSMSERRDIFEEEVRRLSEMCEYAAVIVELPWSEILTDEHQHGARAKSISRTVISWQINYPGVHWWFCASRYHAEQVCFRLLEKFWWMKMRERTRATIAEIAEDLFRPV